MKFSHSCKTATDFFLHTLGELTGTGWRSFPTRCHVIHPSETTLSPSRNVFLSQPRITLGQAGEQERPGPDEARTNKDQCIVYQKWKREKVQLYLNSKGRIWSCIIVTCFFSFLLLPSFFPEKNTERLFCVTLRKPKLQSQIRVIVPETY